MRQITISQNDANQRLDKFLIKTYSNFPKALIYKYIRLKRIKINDKRTEISYILQLGDNLKLYVNDDLLIKSEKKYDFMYSSDKLNIVYEDQNILLVDKPQGLIVHPDDKEFRDTLITRIQKYLYNKGEYIPENENSFSPALANRIDRNTGGIVIAAKNAETLRILNEKIKSREISKYYLCVVHGKMEHKHQTLTAYLEKNSDKNKVYINNKSNDKNKIIKTEYTVLGYKNNLSLLEINLHTGRTHQIRAHLSSIGHHLLGDGKYGKLQSDKKIGFKHQALYSYKLCFDFKTDAGILSYLQDRQFKVEDVWFAKQLFNINV